MAARFALTRIVGRAAVAIEVASLEAMTREAIADGGEMLLVASGTEMANTKKENQRNW